jgi:hypothetical protein
MSDSNSINPKTVPHGIELRADAVIQGLQTALPPSVTQLVVGSVTYAVPDLIKYVQTVEQPWKDARAAHAVLRQIMQSRPKVYQELLDLLANIKASLQGLLGHDSEALTRFGFKPNKRRKPLTVEQKALRAAKAKLTRQKRGTLGKRQKAAIKTTTTPSITISSSGTTVLPGASSTPEPSVAKSAP